ncbi:MAG: cobalt transporter CbiM [Terriglobia bacterium]|nr:cobalt transporter CbiM [Terriglobia bacterium]
MHIPDGYLSPSTCATLYVLSGSGWWLALKKIKRVLMTRTIPLISVFAAFSFVIMMFNLPLPGGTTAHAVGIAVAAIVLGPWGAILSLSIAITIQALLFGDGGITTLGANCFNMAIVGSLVAWAVYRLFASRGRRNVLAAAIAGYVSINAAAFLAAIEFGIQPVLFHDASGTPLYAPYPLHIAIPAMMIGHLTIAGFAEAALSGGMIAYLQGTRSTLLSNTAFAKQVTTAPQPTVATQATSEWKLWATVGSLLILTPLGTLAVGTAWGEGSAESFTNAPAGLARLSSIWTAPFPSYAPAFIKNPAFGYMLSAMFGVGIILLLSLVARAFSRKEARS